MYHRIPVKVIVCPQEFFLPIQVRIRGIDSMNNRRDPSTFDSALNQKARHSHLLHWRPFSFVLLSILRAEIRESRTNLRRSRRVKRPEIEFRYLNEA